MLRRPGLIPILMLLAGLGATFAAWTLAEKDIRQIQQDKLDFRVNEITANIQSRLKSYEQVLLGTSGLFAASGSVEREEFRIYVDKLKLETNFPGIQGVGYVPLIPATEKARHTEHIRREGFPDYAIRPEGEREIYTPVIYLEPFDWRNQRAFGFDMYSEPVRRAAMRQAWEDGVTTTSGKVTLSQETSQDIQAGFIMYVPVYRNGVRLDNPGDRHVNLVGWAFSPFRMNNLMKGILGKQYGETKATIDLEIYDGGESNPESQLYDSNPADHNNENVDGALHASRKIEFGQHAWTVRVHTLPEFEQQAASDRSHLIGNIGVTLSILIATMVWLLLNGRDHALALAKIMTARLREREVELRKLSGLNQAMLDSSNYTVISADTEGVIRSFNAAAERMLGYHEEDVVGKTTPAIFHDANEIKQHAEKLSRELGMPVAEGFETFIAKARLGQADESEWNYIRKDGSRFPVLLSVTALRGDNGEITGYLGVGQNIEENKRTQQQIMKLSRTIEQSPMSVVMTDINGRIEYVNPKACDLSGYSVDELLGQNPRIFSSNKNSPQTYRELWTTIRSGAEWQGELLNRKKTGELYWEKVVISGLRNEAGNIANYIGVKEDITARKNAERDIQRFKNILDNTLDMIFMFYPDTLHFVYANRGTVEMLGYAREELLNMRVWEIMPHMPEQMFRSHVVPLLNDEKPWLNYETLHRCKDGREFPVEVFLQLVEEESGKRLFVAISRDLSERRKIDKMKNEFIATVSHELRTPLTSIRGSLALLVGGVTGELPAAAKPLVEIAHKNSERLILLVNDILDMEKIEAGKMEFDIQPTKLMPLLKQALDGNRAYAEQYKVSYELENELPEVMVMVDANRLLQVFANLLSNAAKFSPSGGKVSVAVERADRCIRVAVKDNGPGIPDEFKDRIFQKFAQANVSDAQTKGGTGLGLSITKAIIEHMDGSISFDSQPDVLTTFYVQLPEWLEENSLEPCTRNK